MDRVRKDSYLPCHRIPLTLRHSFSTAHYRKCIPSCMPSMELPLRLCADVAMAVFVRAKALSVSLLPGLLPES